MRKESLLRWLHAVVLSAFLTTDIAAHAAMAHPDASSLAPRTIFTGKDISPLIKKAQADIYGKRRKTGGEGIPIRRVLREGENEIPIEDVVTGTVNNKGELVIEKEFAEGFWNDRKRNLILKLYRLLKKSASQAHREFLKEARFRIVDKSADLMRIYRDDEGVYEIIIDRTLFDLQDVDVFPFMALSLQHEFNHPQLHAEISGKPYDPLVVEMTALLANLDMYADMRASRTKVQEVMRMLPAHGFDTGPFEKFLAAEGRGPKERVAAAYALATDPRMNPEIFARIKEIESLPASAEGQPERYIDFKKAQQDYDYRDFPVKPTDITAYGDALEEVFKEPIAAFKKEILPGLFDFFNLKKLKPFGYLNKGLEQRIIDQVIPSLVHIGGPAVRAQLEKILATSDYSMDLKSKAAEALLEISFYRAIPVITNPFFGKEIISYLKQLRGDKRFWELTGPVTQDIVFKLWLLGNVRVTSAQLYRDIRSEITWWALNTRNIMNEFTSSKKLYADRVVTIEH